MTPRLIYRLILLLLSIFAIPVIAISVFYILRMTSLSQEKAYLSAEANAKQLQVNFQNQFELLMASIEGLTNDSEFSEFFSNNYEHPSAYFADYLPILKKLSYSANTSLKNTKIALYTANPTIIPNQSTIIAIDKKYVPAWYMECIQDANKITFEISNATLVLRKAIFSRKEINMSGVLTVTIPESMFYEFYKNEIAENSVYLIDSENIVFSSNHKDKLGKLLEGADSFKATPSLEAKDKDQTTYTISQSVLKENSKLGEWFLIYEASLSQHVINPARVLGAGIFIFIACLLFVTVAVLLISQNLAKRINRLSAQTYENDIKIKELEIEKIEARMQALHSQIKPHFLFNALQTISMMLLSRKDDKTYEVVNNLALLMRKTIDWDREDITLREELQITEYYFAIQKARFNDKYEFEMLIDPEYLDNKILKFTIEPIVENAIVHGLEPTDRKGLIKVSANRYGNFLDISICDNGVGMSKTELSKLLSNVSMNDKYTKNIGVRNVNQRLKLFFGEQYGIVRIESKEDVGTTIVLRIPVGDVL